MHVVLLRNGSYGPLVLCHYAPLQNANQRSALLPNRICFSSLTKFSSSLAVSWWCRVGAWLLVRILFMMGFVTAMKFELCIFLQYLVYWKLFGLFGTTNHGLGVTSDSYS